MTCIVRQPRGRGQATIPADYRHRLGITDDSRKEALHRHALRLEWFTVLWNVIEAVVAIVAGVIVGSTALIAFGADSLIEVTSAVGLLWRLYRARAGASAEEHSAAERKALYIVAATFFALVVYIAYESISALLNRETPETSMVGLVLSILSLIIMPVLAYTKQRTGQQMGSEALQADAVETSGYAAISRSPCSLVLVCMPPSAGGGRMRSGHSP